MSIEKCRALAYICGAAQISRVSSSKAPSAVSRAHSLETRGPDLRLPGEAVVGEDVDEGVADPIGGEALVVAVAAVADPRHFLRRAGRLLRDLEQRVPVA